MLMKPKARWTEFQLEGCSSYYLSYLDDIAFEWINQAIWSLETMKPFCVKGFLEPYRFLCTVSYWNFHIIVENEKTVPIPKEDIHYQIAHINMIEFCQNLYEDILNAFNEWVYFTDIVDDNYNAEEKSQLLSEKLDKLKALILEKEHCFKEQKYFLLR